MRRISGDPAGSARNMLKMVESTPMGQFARFPGDEIPNAALDQLIALSSGGFELVFPSSTLTPRIADNFRFSGTSR